MASQMRYTIPSMKTVMMYTTFPNTASARQIVRRLLNKRLIACANIFPVASFYRWDSKVKRSGEIAVLLKTKKMHATSIKKQIEKLHPYDVPVIELFETTLNNPALRWIAKETR